mmetsp:Transcript_69066/g.150911  ORF Transcript_69066/g.150911 Transcript_69066/m.150911 type:complete len:227 (+) Transcript_69066:914-1594(+)
MVLRVPSHTRCASGSFQITSRALVVGTGSRSTLISITAPPRRSTAQCGAAGAGGCGGGGERVCPWSGIGSVAAHIATFAVVAGPCRARSGGRSDHAVAAWSRCCPLTGHCIRPIPFRTMKVSAFRAVRNVASCRWRQESCPFRFHIRYTASLEPAAVAPRGRVRPPVVFRGAGVVGAGAGALAGLALLALLEDVRGRRQKRGPSASGELFGGPSYRRVQHLVRSRT